MASLPWSENWRRSYKITIGTREVSTEVFTVQDLDGVPPLLLSNDLESDTLTTPSNARTLSNLPAEGFSERGFTFKFNSVQKLSSQGSEGEKSTLTLYGLDAELISIINQDKCLVIIEAGYGGKTEVAYSGDVVKVTPEKNGAEEIYHLQCASGAFAMRNTLVNMHYDESLSEEDIIIDMAKRFPGTALGTYGLNDQSGRFKTGGKNFNGSLVTNFDNIMAKNNLSWAHFNGKIVITPYRLIGKDYDHFARTNYTLNEDLIKAITDTTDNNKSGTADTKSKLKSLQINTFYIPIGLGQLVTIPTSDYTTGKDGTYQVKARRLILESKGNAWDVVLEVEQIS